MVEFVIVAIFFAISLASLLAEISESEIPTLIINDQN